MKFFCWEFAVIFINGCKSLGNDVGIYRRNNYVGIYRHNYRGTIKNFAKKKQVDDVEVFASNFTNEITEGFKPGFLYSDVTLSPTESPRESPTEIFRQ
jgi:hypothetical protein